MEGGAEEAAGKVYLAISGDCWQRSGEREELKRGLTNVSLRWQHLKHEVREGAKQHLAGKYSRRRE